MEDISEGDAQRLLRQLGYEVFDDPRPFALIVKELGLLAAQEETEV